MSAIEIRHGSARVELDSDDFEYADGGVSTSYRAEDGVKALVAALKAVDSESSSRWLNAIERGAHDEGLSL